MQWLVVVQVVKEVIDPQASVTYRENTQDDPHKRKPDISKAREFLGWEPKIALRDGLKMMVEDFRRRIEGMNGITNTVIPHRDEGR